MSTQWQHTHDFQFRCLKIDINNKRAICNTHPIRRSNVQFI
uniref:Uncharacterized protein n=1 Tax=Lepeophtheirus salmonis TaxID=72036 RepID=A0A0K2VEN9_LEPSM